MHVYVKVVCKKLFTTMNLKNIQACPFVLADPVLRSRIETVACQWKYAGS